MIKRTIIKEGIINDSNDTFSKGVYELNNGMFLVVTYSTSKEFKTEKGAVRFYNKVTGK